MSTLITTALTAQTKNHFSTKWRIIVCDYTSSAELTIFKRFFRSLLLNPTSTSTLALIPRIVNLEVHSILPKLPDQNHITPLNCVFGWARQEDSIRSQHPSHPQIIFFFFSSTRHATMSLFYCILFPPSFNAKEQERTQQSVHQRTTQLQLFFVKNRLGLMNETTAALQW